MKTLWKPAILVIITLAFMYFVYPTRYYYLPTTSAINPQGTLHQFPVRIDRISGKTEILVGLTGWLPTVR
jgi:hypothetical protein